MWGILTDGRAYQEILACLDLIRVKHDVKLLPRFDLSLMRTDQNDTKLVMVLTTSAIPVKGNVIYAHIFTLHMIRISISFQLSK